MMQGLGQVLSSMGGFLQSYGVAPIAANEEGSQAAGAVPGQNILPVIEDIFQYSREILPTVPKPIVERAIKMIPNSGETEAGEAILDPKSMALVHLSEGVRSIGSRIFGQSQFIDNIMKAVPNLLNLAGPALKAGKYLKQLPELLQQVGNNLNEFKSGDIDYAQFGYRMAKSTSGAMRKIYEVLDGAAQAVKLEELAPVGPLISDGLKHIAKSFDKMERELDDFAEGKIDAYEFVSNQVRDLGEFIVGLGPILSGFLELGILVNDALPWLDVLGIVSFSVSLCSIASEAHGWYRNAEFFNELKEKYPLPVSDPQLGVEDYEVLVTFLLQQKEKTLEKQFLVEDGSKVKERVETLWNNFNKAKSAEAKAQTHVELKSGMEALKGRVAVVSKDYKVKLGTSAMNAVASGIFLTAPFFPAIALLSPLRPFVNVAAIGVRRVWASQKSTQDEKFKKELFGDK